MTTFIGAMNDYREGITTRSQKLILRIEDAIQTLHEKDSKVIISHREKELAVIFLKEVIDRVIVIDFEKIPDTTNENRWRLKNTEIVLRKVAAGDRQGEWLITENTWKRAKQFYQRVKHLPYLEGSGQGAKYLQPWMEKYLPTWSKKDLLGLKNWAMDSTSLSVYFRPDFKVLFSTHY